jgi:proline dehydrogenase
MDKIFNNTEVAFSLKSDTELDRAYFLFKMIDNQPLVKNWNCGNKFCFKSTFAS